MDKKYKGTFRKDRKSKEQKEGPKEQEQSFSENDDMRLNKYLAHSGFLPAEKPMKLLKRAR
jgi:hypothetical protein